MSKSAPSPAKEHRIYPAYCFSASPTFNAWVKLSAADVQALRSEPGFQSQHVYFHLNHPIRFVRLVGVVVAIDDINLKYTVLTLDDGSGATIEVKIKRLTPDVYNSVESPSNTMVDNVNVYSGRGIRIFIDKQEIDIGTVIKVKCTIGEFRDVKQLEMKRAGIVTTTDEEAKNWLQTAEFKRDVLSQPWRLTKIEHQKIKEEIKAEEDEKQAERARNRKRQKMRAAKEAEREERKKARAEKLTKRVKELETRDQKERVMMNSGALI